ncbi:MAG: hypothetical protein WAL56_03440 [Candidatus Sulfotelmatobacter sp.]
MSVRSGFALFLALSTLLFLAACGSNNGVTNGVAPPTGGFSASALNGSYVFSSAGFNVDGYYMVMTGAFTANGSRGISGGAIDIVTSDPVYGVSTNQPIAGTSSYTIGVDGRGTAQLVTNSPAGTVELDFVLSSSSHGLVTEYDVNGSGSGTLDLQSTASQSQFAGSYTFDISGTGLGTTGSPFAMIGSMTLNSTGNVTAGFEDFNNGGGATVDEALSTSSVVTIGTGTAPGTAELFTALGTYTFDVYAIDSTHLKFIETDGQLILAGDAYTQGTSLPVSGTLAFTMSGGDTSGLPLALGGIIPLDGNGNVLTGGAEDFNDGGVAGTDSGFGGGFSTLAGGRSVLTLTSFVNSAANQVAGTYTFAAYPFSSNGVTGLELLEIDNAGVTSGVAYLQTGTSFAGSQGYGLNLSAVDLGTGSGEFEEDDIAEFTTTSSGFSGVVDFNDEGTVTPAQSLTGSYAAATGSGRYSATTTNAFNFNFYAVNNSTFLMLETDSSQIGAGIIELQNASGSAGAEPGISMHRANVPHARFRRK